MYGVTFPDKKLMEEYKRRMEEAKKRDHRRLGTQQKLFFFDPVSPGSAFFLPRGMTICKRLIQVRSCTAIPFPCCLWQMQKGLKERLRPWCAHRQRPHADAAC